MRSRLIFLELSTRALEERIGAILCALVVPWSPRINWSVRIPWGLYEVQLRVRSPSKSSLASFSRTFSLLLRSGVNIIESLDITRGTANNAIVEDALLNAKEAVQRGEQISQPLAASTIFPAMVVSMISIGEETGAMDAMLAKVADFYEREVDEAVDQLTAALEPMMIVFLGVIIGLIVAGMFLPMFSIIGTLSK